MLEFFTSIYIYKEIFFGFFITSSIGILISLYPYFIKKEILSIRYPIIIFPLLSGITFLAILAVKSSLALSLGMVGALSIVRFRTPIKDPLELILLFFSIAVGIGCAAGYFIETVLISFLLLFFSIMLFRFFYFDSSAETKGYIVSINSKFIKIQESEISKLEWRLIHHSHSNEYSTYKIEILSDMSLERIEKIKNSILELDNLAEIEFSPPIIYS